MIKCDVVAIQCDYIRNKKKKTKIKNKKECETRLRKNVSYYQIYNMTAIQYEIVLIQCDYIIKRNNP